MIQTEPRLDTATLMRLVTEALSPDDAPGLRTGRDWAIRFLPLGAELRTLGVMSHLRQTTVTDPMDPVALRALWLACQASVEGAGSNPMVQLVNVLTSVLDAAGDEMGRFQNSVRNVLRWISEHRSID